MPTLMLGLKHDVERGRQPAGWGQYRYRVRLRRAIDRAYDLQWLCALPTIGRCDGLLGSGKWRI